jgi:Bacterial Ig-like domain/Bacterial Ig domain
MRKLLFIASLSLATAGLFTHLSSAAFTSSTTIAANGITADALRNYFSVAPGSDVQPGTSTPVGSGDVDSFSIDLGMVPSARTFSSVFRITNVSGAARTAEVALSAVPQVVSVSFAGGGSSVTLAAGASTTLTVTTSPTVAGRGMGTVRLRLSGSSWLYRDYSFRLDAAPEAPGAPAATQLPAGRIDLAWPASSTTTNLDGYDIYRSSGAAFTKLNATPQTALTYSDTATVDGTSYVYKIRAVSSGTPVLQSLDSTSVTVVADATAPGQATSIGLANGGGAGGAYVNNVNASSLSVNVALPGGSLATDVVRLTINGSVTATRAGSAGAGTITFTGLNVSGLGDGGLTLSVTSTDLAGNVSGASTATVTKDTAAPAMPTAVYTDNNNAADVVTGTAEVNASLVITKTLPLPIATYTATANGSGAYAATVAVVNGKLNPSITVTYVITATDAAGNTSAARTLTYSDTR